MNPRDIFPVFLRWRNMGNISTWDENTVDRVFTNRGGAPTEVPETTAPSCWLRRADGLWTRWTVLHLHQEGCDHRHPPKPNSLAERGDTLPAENLWRRIQGRGSSIKKAQSTHGSKIRGHFVSTDPPSVERQQVHHWHAVSSAIFCVYSRSYGKNWWFAAIKALIPSVNPSFRVI